MNLIAYLCFFLSGTSSLIFQTIWARMLHHVFGSTSVAISSVVSVFMGGLGLGSWLFGKYADRIKHPVITYATAEVGVAICALIIPFLVTPDGFLHGVNAWLRVSFGNNLYAFSIVRFLCIVPILIVPTTLMGSTLPLLARHFVQNEKVRGRVGSGVGRLYAINTAGALCGTFLAAFVLLPGVGLAATNLIAALVNVGLASLIWIFRKQLLAGLWTAGEKLQILPAKHAVEPAPPDPALIERERQAEEDVLKTFSAGPPQTIKIGIVLVVLLVGVAVANVTTDLTWVRFAWGAVCLVGTAACAGLWVGFSWARQLALAGSIVAVAVGALVQIPLLLLGREPLDTPGPLDWVTVAAMIGAGGGIAAMIAERRSALWCDRKRRGLETEPVAAKPEAPEPSIVPISPLARKLVFVAFGLGGVSALGYEIVWSRALAMVIGSSVYSFALILMSFLLGIAGGSAAASSMLGSKLPPKYVVATAAAFSLAALLPAVVYKVEMMWVIFAVVTLAGVLTSVVALTRRTPVLAIGLVQLLIAASAIVNYLYQDEIPFVFARMVASLTDLPDHISLVQLFMFMTAVLCTLPATLGMGVMFPLCVRVWSHGTGATVGKDVGVLYAGNTVGAIAGSWLPGFILMPLIGMEKTLQASVGLNLLIALGLLIASATDEQGEEAAEKEGEPSEAGEGSRERRMKAKDGDQPWSLARVLSAQAAIVYILAPLIPALAAVLYYGTTRPSWGLRWDLSKMTLGVFRVSLAADVLDPERWGEPDLVYYHDGLSTTVTVERWGRHYALKNNGKVDASNGDDMPTQVMVAGYPLLLHPSGGRDLDVAVVGFGSGVTLGTALQFPVRGVDVIELERSIPQASQYFRDVNHLTYSLSDFPYVSVPRLHVINDDGRNYLAATPKRYDIVISEPSNPWITGVSDLFTTDHFQIAKRRLRRGGIFSQWVQLYEMSPENIKTIYRTFAQAFRYVIVFAAEDFSSDTVLVGSDSPIPLDLNRVRAGLLPPRVRQALEAAYVYSPHDLFARVILASREEVMRYTTYEARLENGNWRLDVSANGTEDCPRASCRRWGATVNTDDNAHIEFAAPRDLIGFQRYEGYLAQIYSPDWPYGKLDRVLRGFGTGDDAAREYAELAMSLIAHGRKLEAARFVERSSHEGRARETAIALETLRLLMTSEGEPRVTVETPVPGPQLEPGMVQQLTDGFAQVQRSVDSGAWAQALQQMEEIPAPLRLNSGPSMRFLYGYLLYKAAGGDSGTMRSCIDQLEELVRTDEDYVRHHPEIYYFLARAHDSEFNSDRALRNMRAFVEARLSGQALQSHPLEDESLEEPPPGEAPTTDAPGEAPKESHNGRDAEGV